MFSSGLSGELLSTDGIITYAVDDTKPDGSHPSVMGYVSGDCCQQMGACCQQIGSSRGLLLSTYLGLLSADGELFSTEGLLSTYLGELLSTDGIITYAVDDTKPDSSHPSIMG